MKWYSPQIGDTRKVKKFAWLPVYCNNGFTIWLEWYIAEQRYIWFVGGECWYNDKVTPINELKSKQ